MIVPSIDLQDGQAVQLVGGETKALDAGDPRPLAKQYGMVGEIAVVDLDAALGRGSNTAVIEDLIDLARCRVGGGIRDVKTAVRWLDRVSGRVDTASDADMRVPAWPINALFDAALRVEWLLLHVTNLPVGTSLMCVAEKPRDPVSA